MTRLLWHSADPRMASGYAKVTRLFVPRIADHGWDVALATHTGTVARPDTWRAGRRDIPVYPPSEYEPFGQDVVRGHFARFGADLAITMGCTWNLLPAIWRDLRTIHITPIDVEGMSVRDLHVITETRNTPAAVCRWGEAQMKARNLDPVLYLPHAVDTRTFRPPRDRKQLRQALGMDGLFVVGMCAINQEPGRKNWDPVFRAFALFHKEHPKSLLRLHTLPFVGPSGSNLRLLAERRGIAHAIDWSDEYDILTGSIDDRAMATWFGTLNVLVMVGNEGFGLPTIEAMACGTPVIGGDWGPHPELGGGSGWLVGSDLYDDVEFNATHRADWRRPDVHDLAAALGQAYEGAGERRVAARKAALAWDLDRVWEEHWVPVLKELGD